MFNTFASMRIVLLWDWTCWKLKFCRILFVVVDRGSRILDRKLVLKTFGGVLM